MTYGFMAFLAGFRFGFGFRHQKGLDLDSDSRKNGWIQNRIRTFACQSQFYWKSSIMAPII